MKNGCRHANTRSTCRVTDCRPCCFHLIGIGAPATDDVQPGHVFHVALSLSGQDSSCYDTPWSIVPVTTSSALAPSTIHFSPSSPALQSFASILQRVTSSRFSGLSRKGLEIYVLGVTPLPLEAVFVNVDCDSIRRLQKGEATSNGDSHLPRVERSKVARASDALVTTAIRSSLSSLKVIHAGDFFSLPLAPDPLTSAAPNPGKIVLCEPVAQGLLASSTKIILTRGKAHGRSRRQPSSMIAGHQLRDVHEVDDDGDNTDQFFSAAEERYGTDAPADGTYTTTETETELSGSDGDSASSDDSMDNIISLQFPPLSSTDIGGLGSAQPGTPMTLGLHQGRKTNGMATPGSVVSNITSLTARPGQPHGRLFRAHGLQRPIASHQLHPKPPPEEDEEARIYVEMPSLSKINCFSGDWVRIEFSEPPASNGSSVLPLGSFCQSDAQTPTWRPVRVYGLPEKYSNRLNSRPRNSISSSGDRRPSFFEARLQRPALLNAYASPLLLANLDGAEFVRISALKQSSYRDKNISHRAARALRPPYARNIVIRHIRTPLSTERMYQTAVLGGLKRYFAQKVRLVRTGDLVAVPIDTVLGHTLQEAPDAGGCEVDDVMALTVDRRRSLDLGRGRTDAVAWFKIGHIQIQKLDVDEDDTLDSIWGSIACVDSGTVGMHGSGFEIGRIPGTSRSSWPNYLGIRNSPEGTLEGHLSAISEPKTCQPSPLHQQLRELIVAATSPRAIHLRMPPIAILLTSTHRNIGKLTLAKTACADVGIHSYVIDAYDILGEGGGGGSDVKTEGHLRSRAERAISCGPCCCALVVQHIEAFTADRISSTLKEILANVRVLIATANEIDRLPDSVRALFTHELKVEAPDEVERQAILQSVVDDAQASLEPSLDLSAIALKTAALVAGDLVDVVERALIAREHRLTQLAVGASRDGIQVATRDVQIAGGASARCLTAADFEVAIEAARKTLSDSMGAPKIPNVTWDDVGGLESVKGVVTETIQLPLERPELFAKGMKKRSGLLFYGPPGTGKTLLAKAIATEYSLNFFSIKGPELLNMYIGESEANVRRVFQRARDARPCVVFFDELDSVAPKRGNQGDSGGVMDRIVSQLLAELDGMSGGEEAEGVFVIGATNRPDLLDPALLRPGRFDKMLYLGVSDTHDKQLIILEALTRK